MSYSSSVLEPQPFTKSSLAFSLYRVEKSGEIRFEEEKSSEKEEVLILYRCFEVLYEEYGSLIIYIKS